VYASGFTPRVAWRLTEGPCAPKLCADLEPWATDLAKEDGTMTFYVKLPSADDPVRERVLVMTPEPASGAGPPGDAPSIKVAGHNPGGGFGYPAGTLTGIAAVDEVIALSQAVDTAGIRSRVVHRDGTTTSGNPVRGIATWQCTPYVLADPGSNPSFEYPAGLVYAVYRIPAAANSPLRYRDAAFGIAWYDGGAGLPLGGLTLVTANGQIVGTEIRCGTTPGYHVHNFTDFILAPFSGPAPATPTLPPGAPSVGNSGAAQRDSIASFTVVEIALVVIGLAILLGGWSRGRAT
jgi:hypothetical protein